MNTRIDDALDVIEFTAQHERSTLCRKQEATLPGYTTKMVAKLKKVIARVVAKADKRNETIVSTVTCTDRYFVCFGDRLTNVTIMAYPQGSVYLTINWALFIRDHKLHDVIGRQLVDALDDVIRGYRVFNHGETFKHEYEFVLVKPPKERA